MFKYLLLISLLAYVAYAKPLQQLGELTPHVFIVTPQAQLQLDSLAHGAPVIQHLSPYTRFVSPHEETIVYIPASAAGSRSVASIVPKYQFGDIVARSASDISARQDSQASWITTACNNIPNVPNVPNLPQIPNLPDYPNVPNLPQIPNLPEFPNVPNLPPVPNVPEIPIPQLPQTPLPSIEWPGISEAASGVFPNLPIIGGSPSNKIDTSASTKSETKTSASSSGNANQKLPLLSNIKHIEYEIPVTPILVNEPRHQHYAAIIAPSPAQIVDYVQTPVFLSPSIPTIKGRSLEKPIIALPSLEIPRPEALPLAEDLKKNELLQEKSEIFKKEKILELEKPKDIDSIKLKPESEALKPESLSEAGKILPQTGPSEQPQQAVSELKPTAATKLESDAQEI